MNKHPDHIRVTYYNVEIKRMSNDVIVNVLKRRECGTYLATARRHRRRLKIKKKDE